MILKTTVGVFAIHILYDVEFGTTLASIHPTFSDERVCALKDRPCHTPGMCTGKSYCHKNDSFCKSKGRKLALARAMKLAGYSREVRTAIWKEYFHKVGY